MSLGYCGTRQMPALGRIRAVRGWIGLVLPSLAVGACATPIRVTRRDPLAAQQDLTRKVLFSGEASSSSRIILNRKDLASQFKKDPWAALGPLHTEVASGSNFAMQIFVAVWFLRALRAKTKRYADLYNAKTLTDDAAKSLLDEALAIEQAEVSMRQAYVPKLSAALPATKVARYLQIENKIRAVIKYELVELPIEVSTMPAGFASCVRE